MKAKGKFDPVHAMNAYGGVVVYVHSFLSFALDGNGQLHILAAVPPVGIEEDTG